MPSPPSKLNAPAISDKENRNPRKNKLGKENNKPKTPRAQRQVKNIPLHRLSFSKQEILIYDLNK